MAKKRKVRKTVKKRATKSVKRSNVAGARSAPKRSTKARRKKKSARPMTLARAARQIFKNDGED